MKNFQAFVPPPRRELRVTPVRLCNDISRLCRARMRGEGEMDGVLSQPGARAILSMLGVSDGLSQRELVKATYLRPPTVSVILQKMEEVGIVERRVDALDRRIVRVHLTERGRETDARIQQNDAHAMAGLSADECETLLRLLGKIRDNLVAAEEEAAENGEEEESEA